MKTKIRKCTSDVAQGGSNSGRSIDILSFVTTRRVGGLWEFGHFIRFRRLVSLLDV